VIRCSRSACGGRLRPTVGLSLILVVVLAGCGTQTVVKTVASGGSSTTAPRAATGSPQKAKVGDTLTLKGNGGESMAVTVDQVMDPLQVGQYDQPDSGRRFVGIQITLKNVGSAAYSDSPSNGSTLLSNTNEQAKGQIVSGGPCGNDFASSANIAPGDTQKGCIPFEMPVGQTPATFQFTLNSGFADQTGQWSLAGAPTSTAGSPGAGTTGTTINATASGNTTTNTNGAVATLPNQCSPGLAATQAVSCGLANNMFYEYYKATQSSGSTTSLSVWSPATKRYYPASCSTASARITCSISGTSDPNAQVQFTQAALDAYSPQQASSYAADHDLGPNG
jgi:uncharacterized protein DUF4352